MTNISSLPPEILVKIFRFYLQTETQYDFINCVSRVCRDWQKLCIDPTCWENFDGTLSFDVLKELCRDGILKCCKMLVFSTMDNDPTAEEMEKVYSSLPQLKSINFSRVMGRENKNFFDELACKCPALQEIVYNDKFPDYNTRLGIRILPANGFPLFKDFLKLRGTDLVSLVFSNLYVNSIAANDFFRTIGLSCPNLEVLKVENIDHAGTFSFPTEHMQKQCPKLRILCLGYPVVISKLKHSAGFQNLEIFKNPSKLNKLYPMCAIESVIFASKNLKELDIRECVFKKRKCLHPPNYSHLENLDLSFGNVYNFSCFTDVIHKWAHSLKVLNLSNMIDACIDNMFSIVICHNDVSFPNLTTLNLNGTYVSKQTVLLLTKKCLQLRVLHLEDCLYLGEFSSKYEGVTAIKELFRRLENHISSIEMNFKLEMQQMSVGSDDE